jgi:hypothetical protein
MKHALLALILTSAALTAHAQINPKVKANGGLSPGSVENAPTPAQTTGIPPQTQTYPPSYPPQQTTPYPSYPPPYPPQQNTPYPPYPQPQQPAYPPQMPPAYPPPMPQFPPQFPPQMPPAYPPPMPPVPAANVLSRASSAAELDSTAICVLSWQPLNDSTSNSFDNKSIKHEKALFFSPHSQRSAFCFKFNLHWLKSRLHSIETSRNNRKTNPLAQVKS